MSIATDRTDVDTLAVIGRNPGSKRTDAFIVKAAVGRLILAGLVAQPNTTGRLYLTEAGIEAVWAPEPRAVQGNGWSSDAPQACGLDGCDCHLVPIVLDGRFGNGVTHACKGSWNLLGQNAAGHDVFRCTARPGHLYVAAHRSAPHKCLTGQGCDSAEVAEPATPEAAAQARAVLYHS